MRIRGGCGQAFGNIASRGAFVQIVYFISGFIASRAAVFGSYAPFGISIMAAAPFKNMLASVFGAAIGYCTISGTGNTIRYVTAMIALAAIRWTLNDIARIRKSKLFAPIITFMALIATGLAMMSVSGFSGRSMVLYMIEAVLGSSGAYFLSRTITISYGTKSLGMLSIPEISCLVLSLCIMILSFSSITIGSLSIGRILSVVAILFCARYGSISGGAIAGISAGIVMSLSSSEMSFLAGSYAFGGLMAGMFSTAGRLASAIAFILCNGIISMQTGDLTLVILGLYEVLAASLIFIILPKDTGRFLGAIFMEKDSDTRCEGLRRSVIMRLDFASKALSDVSSDVEDVAQKLAEVVSPDMSGVYKKAVSETCRRCGLKTYCWEREHGATIASFDCLDEVLRKNGEVTEDDFRQDFRKRCCKIHEMANAVNRNYDNYITYEAAQRRVDEVRAVVAGQFCGLGEILGEMAEEYESYEKFDTDAAHRISVMMKDEGYVPMDISCRIDRLGRMSVEIEPADTERSVLKRSVLTREVSKLCGRRFENPAVTMVNGRCRIVFSERPVYDVDIATAQHICGNGRLCGDHFKYFCDGMGRMVAVISDGMGTGGRAAVDGSMASSIIAKLIKAGLGFDCALKVVNSALMVKSGDESLATLDVLSFDMFTGGIELMKAGAPMTFIRKGGKVFSIESPSLPVGILPNVEFSYSTEALLPGDIVVMLSDGAVATGEDWIANIIRNWNKSSQELANLITDEATARRSDGHDDDITVLTMIVQSANGDEDE